MTRFMRLDRTYLPSQSNPLKTYSEAHQEPGEFTLNGLPATCTDAVARVCR